MQSKNIAFSGNKQELIKPILPGLPISIFTSAFSPETYSYVNWHWHDAFQFCYVSEGIVDFDLPGQTFSITAGSGIFINYQCLHLIRSHEDSVPSSYLCLDLPPSFISYDTQSRIFLRYLKPIIDHPYPNALILSRHSQNDKKILSDLLEIDQLSRSDAELIELDIRIKIIEIWKLICQKLKRNVTESKDEFYNNDRLKQIISFIHTHYHEKITLDEIASQVSLSRSECSRFFKKLTGQALFSYLISYRLNKGIDLIRDTDMSIAEIAQTVGFCSQSYFTDCFRKEKGITPKKYKELSTRKLQIEA
jgi:AraC-like DNA-binding protein/quercetin dioxygenase-like cupin family protein